MQARRYLRGGGFLLLSSRFQGLVDGKPLYSLCHLMAKRMYFLKAFRLLKICLHNLITYIVKTFSLKIFS